MKINPVKGTNDYLPKEARLRDRIKKNILEVYTKNGFSHIYTPALESAENLQKSDGGENLNLIFNILKRGDKLQELLKKGVAPGEEDALFDLGLRYDLTLPLSRYVANNYNDLVMPFKCIQTGNVYRAERPQKGRLREFIQCDIDIIGSESPDCETELILVTAQALEAAGLSGFKVKINDRRLLRALLEVFGFENDIDSVCISLDKADKIGIDGVGDELLSKGFKEDSVDALKDFMSDSREGFLRVKDILSKAENKEEIFSVIEGIERIMENVCTLSDNAFDIDFDISLVRGQGYYTGTIFEVVSDKFKGSVAGGGRYDKLIGKFLNKEIPAVGFSIGFERLYSILSETCGDDNNTKRIAFLYEEGDFKNAYEAAENFRKLGFEASLFIRPKKAGKFIDKLKNDGFDGFVMDDYETVKSFS